MTLKAALYIIKKNPTSLLKKDKQFYFVNPEPYYGGVPHTVRIYDGLDSWSDGFAWACAMHENRALQVGYKGLIATDWEIVDGTDIVVTHNRATDDLESYVTKFDEGNKYHPDKSTYGQFLLEEGNKLLQSMNSPCVLCFKFTNYGSAGFALEAPDGTDVSWRFKSTKALVELKDRLIQAEENERERKLFEDNKPSQEIIIRKVTMSEFLDRLQNSKKLWYLDATNSWRRNKSGQAVGKDWEKALLEPVTLTRSRYGDARTDRLATRNAFTNSIGLPKCAGMEFYSLDDKRNCGGTFFADVVKGYGKEGDCIIVDDNEMLVLVHEGNLPNPHAEYNYLQALTSPRERRVSSYHGIRKILNKRLGDFKSYSRR